MTDRLQQLVADTFGVAPESVTDDAGYGRLPGWDSINHVKLIFALEDAFAVSIPDEEIPDLTSMTAIRECLARHGVDSRVPSSP